MMTFGCKATIVKNGPKQWVSRAGLRLLLLLTVLSLVACYPAPYRDVSRSIPEKNGGDSRAFRTQVFFYPKAGQTTAQQSRDHYECYNWAMKQTGFDPSLSSIPPVQRVRVVPMPPPGYDTVALAIAGAVLGALIAGPRHAAGGALIGAAGGAVAGAASDSARQESARQLEEAYARGDRSHNVQLEGKEYDFRRAMSACLEGRGYSVQ